MKKYLRILFGFLFLPLYATAVYVRNFLFDKGILKSHSFPFPVICIGNLSTGGTGKSPQVEYTINYLLQKGYKLGIVSRGYGRKTKGPILANPSHTALEIGDEARQYVRKFPEVPVMLCEKRVNGVELLRIYRPEVQIIVLDDAFQHRYLKPSYSILLTEYAHPYIKDFLLPAGNLREPKVSAKRADTIILTKCPEFPNEEEGFEWRKKLRLNETQKLLFSKIEYLDMVWVQGQRKQNKECLLVTGIAHPKYLQNYVENLFETVVSMQFSDHHDFLPQDIIQILRTYKNMKDAVIVCTEKDYMRLEPLVKKGEFGKIPFAYIPIKTHLSDYLPDDIFLKYVRNNNTVGGLYSRKNKGL